MENATKGLIVLAGVAFIMAVITNFTGPLFGIGLSAEGASRACSNLALLAIAVAMGWNSSSSA